MAVGFLTRTMCKNVRQCLEDIAFHSLACSVCVAAQDSLARYEAWHYAAAGCAYAVAPNEIAWYLALTHAAAGWAWSAALERTAGYVA